MTDWRAHPGRKLTKRRVRSLVEQVRRQVTRQFSGPCLVESGDRRRRNRRVSSHRRISGGVSVVAAYQTARTFGAGGVCAPVGAAAAWAIAFARRAAGAASPARRSPKALEARPSPGVYRQIPLSPTPPPVLPVAAQAAQPGVSAAGDDRVAG